MTFSRNVEREQNLLRHWRRGDTVKTAALLSNIPAGSVSHYYAKFNRKKEMYGRISEGKQQNPPRSTPSQVATASFILSQTINYVGKCSASGDYSKARDYLETVLLLDDLEKRYRPIIANKDPEKHDEIMNSILQLIKTLSST